MHVYSMNVRVCVAMGSKGSNSVKESLSNCSEKVYVPSLLTLFIKTLFY